MLKSLINDIPSGREPAGTVFQNQELSTNVQAIENHLAAASSNINQLGLWHFLQHQEPARRLHGVAAATSNSIKP